MTVHRQASKPPIDLASSLDQGFTLPARWYTGSDIFEAEQRQIFGVSWQFAGLADQLSRPGDFLTCAVPDPSRWSSSAVRTANFERMPPSWIGADWRQRGESPVAPVPLSRLDLRAGWGASCRAGIER